MAVKYDYDDDGVLLVGFGDRGASLEEIERAARAEFGNWLRIQPENDPAVVGPFDGASLVLAIQTAAAIVQVVEFIRRWKARGTPIHIGAGLAAALAREFLGEQGELDLELELVQRSRTAWPRPVANDPSPQSHYTLMFRGGGPVRFKVVVSDVGEIEVVERLHIETVARPRAPRI